MACGNTGTEFKEYMKQYHNRAIIPGQHFQDNTMIFKDGDL